MSLLYPQVVSHVLVSYLMYSSPDSLMQYGCVHPPVVSHVFWPSCCLRHEQYPVAVVACTCVLLDNCLLEAPGAFSIATYTHRWCVFDGPLVASVYLCAPPRCRLSFVGIIFVFEQPPVTLDSLTFIFRGALRFLLILPCFQQVPGNVRCAEAQLQCFFL